MINQEAEFWLIVDHWIESGLDPKLAIEKAINIDLSSGLYIKTLFDHYTVIYPLWQFGSLYSSHDIPLISLDFAF